MVLRIIFGLFLLIFGTNKLFPFMPMGEMGEAAMAYMGAIMSTKTILMVAIVEIAAGLSLLLNKYGALMMLILMSVSINAVLFHAFLEPASIQAALLMLLLNILMLFHYKDRYKDILRA
jgi:uncharacterized membrane protein YphA (DoxX/SURF4 family)